MIIRGQIGPSNLAYFDCRIKGTDPPFSITATLAMDTGASLTNLMHRDISGLNLDYTKLEKGGKARGIGGTRTIYWLKGVTITFADSDPPNHEEVLDRVAVFKTRTKNAVREAELHALPSLLGIDVLRKYTITFPGSGAMGSRVILEQAQSELPIRNRQSNANQ